MKESLWSKIRTFVKENPHAWWALYLLVYMVLYLSVEHVVDGSGAYWSSWCPLDDKIPFVEGAILIYCSWHVIMILVGLFLLFRDGKAFRHYMQFIAVGFTLATLICFLIPNGQDLRPQSFDHQNLFTYMLQFVYSADTNTNVFPSVHVIGCLALCFAVLESEALKKIRIPLLVWSALIICSTVLVKQHSILDVIGAIVLCLPIWIWLSVRRRKERSIEKTKG